MNRPFITRAISLCELFVDFQIKTIYSHWAGMKSFINSIVGKPGLLIFLGVQVS